MDHIAPEVLLYHRVTSCVPDNQYLSVTPEHFEAHLAILCRERKVVSLHDLVQAACKGRLVEGGVAITFDDGYADNLLQALPLLEAYRCHATVFVTAGLLGHAYGFWYDVLEDVLLSGRSLPCALSVPLLDQSFPLTTPEEILSTHDLLLELCKQSPARVRRLLLHEIVQAAGIDPATYASSHPLLTAEQVAELAASPWVEIGAHTLTHPVLARLPEAEQRHEITASIQKLEKLTGKPLRILAYPFGNREAYDATTCRLAREAGVLGIANIQGSLTLPLDPQNVPRRLVRNWSGPQFRRWLHAGDRHQLERETVGRRAEMVLRHVRTVGGTYPSEDVEGQFLSSSSPSGGVPSGGVSSGGVPCGGASSVSSPSSGAVPSRRGVAPATQPRRIVHVNTMLGKGGTAGIMQLLQSLQHAAGHDSQMLVGRAYTEHPCGAMFDTAPDPRAEAEAQREGLTDYHFQGSHLLARHPLVRAAEVLHIHNQHGGYCNPWSLAGLSRLHPTVWTLHDMHALTGHCAHAFACTRWQTGCGLCPDLGVYPETPVDNTHRLWRDKQRVYAVAPVHVVTPSRWLARMVEHSLLADHPLTVIPNGIDTSLFTPGNKAAVRARLGIAPDTLVVGSAAYNGPLHNFWKGGPFAMEALNALRQRFPDVLFLGRGNAQEASVPHVRLLPYAFDERDMADFYTALDVMLYPSLADNCPLVVMEAMACGVPVLTFGVGGIPELVEHGVDGVVVPERDAAALCRAALELAAHADTRARMGAAARTRAVAAFDARLMAQRYADVYAAMIAGWRQLPQWRTRLARSEVSALVRTRSFAVLADAASLWQDEVAVAGAGAAPTAKDSAAAPSTPECKPTACAPNSFRADPVSRVFGLDRPGGKPVDRVYIESFLTAHADDIRGRVLEVASNTYTHMFGTHVTRSDILHAQATPDATLVGDLATGEGIPDAAFDCIILTQTVQFIYDVHNALRHAATALAPGGTLLLTASGISQISRYDMDRWGEYWRFTDKALDRMLREAAPGCDVAVCSFGNAGTARAFLDGRSAAELPTEAFATHDNDYQVTLCARVTRPAVRVAKPQPGAELPQTVPSILAPDAQAVLEHVIPARDLIGGYGALQADVTQDFSGIPHIGMYRCQQTDIVQFYPVVCGTDALYRQLQVHPWYYLEDKSEYDVAAQYIAPDSHVLEIGCGRGHFASKISAARYTGLEMNPEAMDICRSKGLRVLAESVAQHAMTHPAVYDAVCAFQVLEHIPDVHAALYALVSCLKPGGHLIFSLPSNDSFARIVPRYTLNMPPHHMSQWSDRAVMSVRELFDLDLVDLHREMLQPEHYNFYAATMARSMACKDMGITSVTMSPEQYAAMERHAQRFLPAMLRKVVREYKTTRGLCVTAIFKKRA